VTRAAIVAALAALVAAGSATAQGIDASQPLGPGRAVPGAPAAPAFPADALRLTLTCRITSRGDPSDAWEEKAESLIYPNKSLQLRMVGRDIVIVTILTPYESGKGDGTYVMKTIGRIWTKGDDSGLNYYSSLFSIPLKLGEKARYFPLGSKNEGDDVVEIALKLEKAPRDSR